MYFSTKQAQSTLDSTEESSMQPQVSYSFVFFLQFELMLYMPPALQSMLKLAAAFCLGMR